MPERCVWVNIAGTRDLVTSWLGGGVIKEATVNFIEHGYSHDLAQYLDSPSFRGLLDFIPCWA
jgi:hypothetical protein